MQGGPAVCALSGRGQALRHWVCGARLGGSAPLLRGGALTSAVRPFHMPTPSYSHTYTSTLIYSHTCTLTLYSHSLCSPLMPSSSSAPASRCLMLCSQLCRCGNV